MYRFPCRYQLSSQTNFAILGCVGKGNKTFAESSTVLFIKASCQRTLPLRGRLPRCSHNDPTNLSLRGARQGDAAISRPSYRLLRFARNDPSSVIARSPLERRGNLTPKLQIASLRSQWHPDWGQIASLRSQWPWACYCEESDRTTKQSIFWEFCGKLLHDKFTSALFWFAFLQDKWLML